MDQATKVLNRALTALVRLELGIGSREEAAAHLRELAEHLEDGGYGPDIVREDTRDSFRVGPKG